MRGISMRPIGCPAWAWSEKRQAAPRIAVGDGCLLFFEKGADGLNCLNSLFSWPDI